MVGKRLVNTGEAAVIDPLQNFDIVTYTGTGGAYSIGNGVEASVTINSGTANYARGSSSYGNNSGKHYFEVEYISANGNGNTLMVGIINAAYVESWTNAQTKMYYAGNGNKYTGGSGTSYGATYAPGDIIGVAYDGTARTVTFYKNNVSQGTAFTGLITNYPSYFPAIGTGLNSETAQFRFTTSEFTYTPPSGYSEWGSATVSAHSGTVNSAVAAQPIDFQPDLVWIKSRSTATNNELHDSLRGEPSRLFSDATNAEMTVANGFVSLDSNGFSLDGTGSGGEVNYSGRTYVAWCFKGGGGAASNTDGTITSSVSANPDAGFSIVSYTGNGNADASVGHGLSSAPELYILKRYDITGTWVAFTNVIDGSMDYLVLNTTAAKGDAGQTAPTSSVLNIKDYFGNISSATYIGYCFHSVDGYQKIGTYTGTSYTQNDISLSFAPRFVMVKNTTSSAGWNIFDLSRDVANGNGRYLQANTNNAEFNIGNGMIFLSNGFRWKDQPDNEFNASGQTYIYLAIA